MVHDTIIPRVILGSYESKAAFRYKERQDDLTVEMVIWELPGKTRERSHELKYRLYCGRGNHCIV